MHSGVPAKDRLTERDLASNKANKIFTIPFSSSRKRATVAIWIEGGAKVRVFCKGAPEVVIERCT